MKREWQRPALTVLRRGTPDEAVLENCKTSMSVGSGTQGSGCNGMQDGMWICNACDASGGS